MLDWWIKNCVAILALLLPVTIILLWLSPAIHVDTLCKAGDDCIREWVSALSGWAAVVAAYATIRTMNAQRAEADKYQRENTELEIMGRLALVRRIRAKAEATVSFVRILRKICADHLAENRIPTAETIVLIENLGPAVFNPTILDAIREYDEKIGLVGIDYSVFARAMEDTPRNLSALISGVRNRDQALWKDASHQVVGFCDLSDMIFGVMITEATRFNNRWSNKIGD
jgi:hypothetical protein